MIFWTHSHVPELSGFNRKQRRFLLKAALALQTRDDPWFRHFLALLFGGWNGAWIAIGTPIASLQQGSSKWIVFATIAVGAGIGGLIYGHLVMSHLRPFLREAIRKHGAELEDIG